jgi:hypothetical protein
MYSIFRLSPKATSREDALGKLGRERASALVRRFVETNITVLELAATVDWLWRKEGYADWRREITKRKGVKVREGRLERAVELLEEIGLSPPVPAEPAS